jgi:ATP-dependent helicase/nuclease subunit A
MEHIPFTPKGKDEESIAKFIEELRERHILTDAEAAAVDPRRIAAFFRSGTGRRAMASEELHKEAPFVMRTQLDGRQVLVQGVIDCYFREGDSFVLVDYKSNYVDRSDPESSAKKLREKYIPQLELYKEALEGICGTKVSESYLYLFGLDDSIKL